MKKKCIKKLKKFPQKKTIKEIISSSKNKNTLTNYFSFSTEKKETKKKNSISKEQENKTNKNYSQYEIIRNPSKPRLGKEYSNILNKYLNIASKCILFTENQIEEINSYLNFIYEKIDSFFLAEKKYIKDDIKKINRNNLLIKLLLHSNNEFFFIPLSLQINDNYKNFKEIFLFNGYNNTKNLFYNFFPCNTEECSIFWSEIFNPINKYIKNFDNEKALYIYSSQDYFNYLKKAEIIFSILNYNIIRIDETDLTKYLKLNKIYEATQSQSISFIPDELNNRMFLLESILNNFIEKWKDITKYNNNKLKSLSKISEDTFNEIDSPSTNSTYIKKSKIINNNNLINKKESRKNKKNENGKFMKNITKYFLSNTEENSLFKVIQSNIYNYCNIQKTLILISDSFSSEEDKKYMINILNKISKSKIPMIILTNSQPLIPNNSKKNNKLIFSSISNKINKKLFIYQYYLILYIELLLGEILNKKNYNSMKQVLDSIKEKVNNFTIEKEKTYLNKLYEITYKLSHKCKYDMETMGYLLKYHLGKIEKKEEFNKKILLIEEDIKEIKINKNNYIDFYDNYEYISFKDSLYNHIEKYSEKLFSCLNNNEEGVNLEYEKLENNYNLEKLEFSDYSLESENIKKIIYSPINQKIVFMKINFNPSISRKTYFYYDYQLVNNKNINI